MPRRTHSMAVPTRFRARVSSHAPPAPGQGRLRPDTLSAQSIDRIMNNVFSEYVVSVESTMLLFSRWPACRNWQGESTSRQSCDGLLMFCHNVATGESDMQWPVC
jgi:hypothetical protein